jgi:hypothetical protein
MRRNTLFILKIAKLLAHANIQTAHTLPQPGSYPTQVIFYVLSKISALNVDFAVDQPDH